MVRQHESATVRQKTQTLNREPFKLIWAILTAMIWWLTKTLWSPTVPDVKKILRSLSIVPSESLIMRLHICFHQTLASLLHQDEEARYVEAITNGRPTHVINPIISKSKRHGKKLKIYCRGTKFWDFECHIISLSLKYMFDSESDNHCSIFLNQGQDCDSVRPWSPLCPSVEYHWSSRRTG